MLSSISDTAPVFAVAVCHNGVCRCTELWAEGDYMRETVDGPFAVFVKTVRRNNGFVMGANAITDQADWEAMERDRPGQQPLIRGGIANEVEAERLCRSSPPPTPRPLPAVPRRPPPVVPVAQA